MANQYNVKRREELEQFLNLVAEQILQNEMSLFIGAGSSMQYGAMNWSDLINSVYSGLDNWDDTDRAQYAELTGVNVKSKICQKLFELNLNSESNNTYLNHLLDFDFKSIWTTNYDNLIEKVLERKTKRYKAIYQYKHFKLLSYPRGSFLFKINGSQTNEESIVITHEDFINYRKSHEGFLILLKRELLCNSFLFLGCSFDDDILRICIKDILNCIDNNGDNYTTNHFAIIAEKDNFKSDYICKDLINHYKINCLKVNQPELSYLISMALMYKVKFNSIFISGASRFKRGSKEENDGKNVCKALSDAFINFEISPYKIILGMGMSIGNFVAGNVKNKKKDENVNRYLQMEPFPFTNAFENDKHRRGIIEKAGIFIFLYGDYNEHTGSLEENGIWKEYSYAKSDSNNIIVPLPCGETSISQKIYEKEFLEQESFTYINRKLLSTFDITKDNTDFFNNLTQVINFTVRERFDTLLDQIYKKFY